MTTNVTGIFKNRSSAESAIDKIEAFGVTSEQISVVMSDETRGSNLKIVENSKAEEGAVAGASVGMLASTVAVALLAAGVIAIPGLNLIATGALVTQLAGLGLGAVGGGLVGGLIGAGIPEHEAKMFEKGITSGSVLVVIETKDSAQRDKVESIFRDADAYRSAA